MRDYAITPVGFHRMSEGEAKHVVAYVEGKR